MIKIIKILKIIILNLVLFSVLSCQRTGFLKRNPPNPSAADVRASQYKQRIDVFTQSSIGKKIDIIWVIDSSGSMIEEINSINNNIMNFVGRLDSYNIDYRVALLLRDELNLRFQIPPQVKDCSRINAGNNRLCYFNAYIGSFNALKTLLNCFGITYTGGYKPEFQNLSIVYKGQSQPSGNIPFSCGALNEPPFGSLSAKFKGFMRPGVHKEIIVVSDDESYLPADSFLSSFRSQVQDFKFHSIVGVNAAAAQFKVLGCQRANVSPCQLKVEQRPTSTQLPTTGRCLVAYASRDYPHLSQSTGGMIMDICSNDWSGIFSKLSQEIIKLTTFALNFNPVTGDSKFPVKVLVNNVERPATEWIYDQGTNSIIFNENKVPQVDSNIKVQYWSVK